jgi:hypothetical protein
VPSLIPRSNNSLSKSKVGESKVEGRMSGVEAALSSRRTACPNEETHFDISPESRHRTLMHRT